jgi:glycerol uptake facilitator-like aquaporin
MATKKTAKKTAAKKPAAKKVVAVQAAPKKPEKAFDLSTVKPGALIAEFIGTFLLAAVLIMLTGNTVAILLGASVLMIVFGVVSGAHLNPAITIALAINKKINLAAALFFIVAQILGAVLAFFALTAINTEQSATYNSDGVRSVATLESKLIEQGYTTQDKLNSEGVDKVITELTGGSATKEQVAQQLGVKTLASAPKVVAHKEVFTLLLEVLGSLVLGFGVGFAFFSEKACRITKGLAIGGGIALGLAIAGTTAILNPAVAYTLGAYGSDVWGYVIYILGPIIGITLGATLFKLIYKDSVKE